MSVSDLLWIFIILSALQSVFARKLLDMRRLSWIDSLQKKCGSWVILLVHRRETMSFLGLPLMRYIDIQDSEGC